jgi:hypothetical protein
LRVFNDYNSYGIFPKDENISHYLMYADDDRAVCIYGNFSKESQKVDTSINWGKTTFKRADKKVTLCIDGKAVPFDGDSFDLPPLGVAAIVVGEADFAAYMRPFPKQGDKAKRYLAKVAEQKRLRACPNEAENYFMRVSVADIAITYENSMVLDLYDNRFVLGEVAEDGTFKKLGYIGKNGFQTEETKQEDFVTNGMQSQWIDLKEICGSGTKNLAILSLHRGDLYYVNVPFYSFVEVELGTKKGETDYKLEFMNELENDRSFINFTVKIK